MGQQDCGTVPVNRPSGNLLFSTLRPVKYNFTLSILVITTVGGFERENLWKAFRLYSFAVKFKGNFLDQEKVE